MFANLKKLYDNELYANVIPIVSKSERNPSTLAHVTVHLNHSTPQGSLLVTMYKNDRSCLTADQYFLTLMYFGNSLLSERQHQRAEEIFDAALQAKKKLKSTSIVGHHHNAVDAATADQFTVAEIRYKLALCLEATRQVSEAVVHLQAIPIKQRSVKANMLLAKLLQWAAYDKNAIAPLKAVLLECPLNLEAIRGLLALAVKPADIIALLAEAGVSAAAPNRPSTDWLFAFIVAQAHVFAGRFAEAVQALRECARRPDVGDNEAILVLLGQCHHYMGDKVRALGYLQRAYAANAHLTDGLMTLAALYGACDMPDDLERLALPTVATTTYTAEYWFVLAQHLFQQGKYEKALHFTQKSCFMRPKNVEAILLKVKIFQQTKNYKEAIVHLRMLQQFADYRFEVHEGLVDVFIATNRLGDAQVVGRDVVRRHKANLSARYYVLLVRPYLVQYEPVHRQRVKGVLKRALEKDEYHMPAAMLLVSLMRQEGDRMGTAALLKKQLAKQPNAKLYTLLAELLSEEKDPVKAVEYYTTAIK